MPQIQRAAIAGCCVGTFFYDVGGAHNKYRSKNLEEFALRMVDLGCNQINICATNAHQDVERQYLEALGFKEVMYKKATGMHVHAADNTELEKALKPFKEKKAEILKKAAEEAKRKAEEAEKKRKEEAEKVRLAKIEKEKKDLEKLASLKVTSNDDVTMAWVRKTYNEYPSISIQSLFNHIFGFQKMPEWERKYDDDAILLSINSRLKKRREANAERSSTSSAAAGTTVATTEPKKKAKKV